MKNPNFLILDEPTNDLDLITLNTLEEFLINFKGCLIVVSHDRYFMDKLVDSLFVFEGDGVISGFTGNYAEYRQKLEDKEKAEKEEQKRNLKKIEPEKAETPLETTKKSKLSFKEKFEFDKLEKEIKELEAEKQELANKLSNPNIDHLELTTISQQFASVSQCIDEKSFRWLELSEKSE
jgi:ATP-binding cassette subfamily F protein uup